MQSIEEIRQLNMEKNQVFSRPGFRTSRRVYPVGEDGCLFVGSIPGGVDLPGQRGRIYDVYLCTLSGMVYRLSTGSYETLGGALKRAAREHRDWNSESFDRLVVRF